MSCEFSIYAIEKKQKDTITTKKDDFSGREYKIFNKDKGKSLCLVWFSTSAARNLNKLVFNNSSLMFTSDGYTLIDNKFINTIISSIKIEINNIKDIIQNNEKEINKLETRITKIKSKDIYENISEQIVELESMNKYLTNNNEESCNDNIEYYSYLINEFEFVLNIMNTCSLDDNNDWDFYYVFG